MMFIFVLPPGGFSFISFQRHPSLFHELFCSLEGRCFIMKRSMPRSIKQEIIYRICFRWVDACSNSHAKNS